MNGRRPTDAPLPTMPGATGRSCRRPVAPSPSRSTPTLRRIVATALVLLLALRPAGADTPVTPTARADEVVAAVRGADDGKLRTLAAAADPDPWLVADELCSRGAGEAAASFARAAPASPDVSELARFVAERVASPQPAAVADAARRVSTASDEAAVNAAMQPVGDVASPFDRASLANLRARTLRRLKSPAAAAEAYVAAADDAERIGWIRRADEALGGAAFVLAGIVDYGRARAVWTRQLDLQRRRGRGDRAAECLANLASIDAQLGNYGEASARFDAAIAELVRLGEPGRTRASLALRNLAVTRSSAGEYAKALTACRQAIDLVASAGEEALRADILITEGDIQLALGDIVRAETAHRRALAAATASGDPGMIGLCNATLGNDLRERGEFDAALAVYEAALEPLTRPEQQPLAMRLLTNLTLVHAGRRDFVRAQECGTRAVALAKKLGDDEARANALQNLAQACRGAGDLKAAAAAADAAIEIAQRVDSAQVASLSWAEVAENAMAAHDPEGAANALRRAIAAAVEMTSGLAEGQGAQARARYGRLFRLANAAAIEMRDAEALFEFAESGRAIEFLASLEQGDAIRAAVVPASLREAEQSARAAESLASVRHQAALAGGDLATIKARRAERDNARARHEDAIGEIRRHARAAVAIFPKPVVVAEARGALAADEALVMYALADEKAAALVLTQKEMRFVPLGATKDLAAACAAWDPAADGPQADAAIAALGKTLVAPLGLSDTTKRVLVSPDGEVYRAPLAALFRGRELVHVPSASSYVLLAADKSERGTKVLAVGAPDYTGSNLAPLPESRAEANAVGNATGDVVITGAAATEASVHAAIANERRWRSVHFAVHGVVNEKRPMLCGLALTPAPPDDGLMTALEVLQWPVRSDLVVLSACDSGGGRVFAGEGLVGMPRAFLFAGSPRVIAASWKVDDAATRALMTKFYDLWRGKGLRAPAALAGAQEFVRADERWRHPRFWAAWTLWGKGD